MPRVYEVYERIKNKELRERKESGGTGGQTSSASASVTAMDTTASRQRSRSGGTSMTTSRRARKAAFTIGENKAYAGVAIFLVIMCPAMLLIGFTEIMGQRVGIDWAPTVGFLFARSGFYVAGYLFQPHLLNAVIGIRRMEELEALQKHSKLNFALLIVENVIGLAAVVSVTVNDPGVRQITFVAYNGVMAFCLAGLFFQARFLRDQVEKSLSSSESGPHGDVGITILKKRLVRIQTTLMKQTFGQGLIFLLQAAIPFLWPYFSYILPITYIIPGTAGINVIKSLRGTKERVKKKSRAANMWTKNPSFGGGNLGNGSGTNEEMELAITAAAEFALTRTHSGSIDQPEMTFVVADLNHLEMRKPEKEDEEKEGKRQSPKPTPRKYSGKKKKSKASKGRSGSGRLVSFVEEFADPPGSRV